MNETGLTVGVLYLPGFARYQEMVEGKEAISLNQADLAAYILGQLKRVGGIKAALPQLRVVDNKDIERAFGAPVPIHGVVTDETGQSIVVEYIDGQLHLHDNNVRTNRRVNLPSWNQESLEKSPGRLPAPKDNTYKKPTTGWLTGGNGDPI